MPHGRDGDVLLPKCRLHSDAASPPFLRSSLQGFRVVTLASGTCFSLYSQQSVELGWRTSGPPRMHSPTGRLAAVRSSDGQNRGPDAAALVAEARSGDVASPSLRLEQRKERPCRLGMYVRTAPRDLRIRLKRLVAHACLDKAALLRYFGNRLGGSGLSLTVPSHRYNHRWNRFCR